jgi:methylated-DNA-[protein]-cysteine S-methyltransferase
MIRDNSEAEKGIAVWLGEDKGQIVKDDLLDDLDAIYAPGPQENAIRRAQKRLRVTMNGAGESAVYYDILEDTPVGQVLVALKSQGVVAVEIGMSERQFIEYLTNAFGEPVLRSNAAVDSVLKQLQEYFDGRRKVFDLPLSLSHLTRFQRRVLEATMDVSCGNVTTYGEIARRLGKSQAARAVGQALARNPIPILIPCHRVLGSDGGLHGYSGGKGIETKKYLLQLEGAYSS